MPSDGSLELLGVGHFTVDEDLGFLAVAFALFDGGRELVPFVVLEREVLPPVLAPGKLLELVHAGYETA